MTETIKLIRQELHRVPESSGHEIQTKNKIREFLKANTGLSVADHSGGILAFYRAEGASETVAFRADFDAVSLPDDTAAHLCGHDGHTAALLGVAARLETLKPRKNVLLIFQHAEETGEGARTMADALAEYGVSEIYGCHNLPGFPFGRVFTSLGTFACASCGLTFHIKGEPAHAAYPETGRSPIRAVSALFQAIEETRSPGRFGEGTIATLIGCSVGQKAFGTSAENAEVWVTVRSRTEQDFQAIKTHFEAVVKQACEADGITYRLELQDEFPATVNDRGCAEKILRACGGSGLLGEPMRWSEDFGHYLRANPATKGAFFGIGAGPCPDLHTRDYQYPDELLEDTVSAFLKLL